MPASWHTPIKLSEAAKAGYNIAVPCFLDINGDAPITFRHDVFIAYTTWNNKASAPDMIDAIKKDVTLAK